jgi:hypothetical protein
MLALGCHDVPSLLRNLHLPGCLLPQVLQGTGPLLDEGLGLWRLYSCCIPLYFEELLSFLDDLPA